MYDFLNDVKSALKITGTYHDNALRIYIDDVKDYLLRAGVAEELVDSWTCKGIVARGVADLMRDGSLSQYFYNRVAQLALYKESEE